MEQKVRIPYRSTPQEEAADLIAEMGHLEAAYTVLSLLTEAEHRGEIDRLRDVGAHVAAHISEHLRAIRAGERSE